MTLSAKNVNLDLFDLEQPQCLWLDDEEDRNIVYDNLTLTELSTMNSRRISLIPGDNLILHYNEHYKDPAVAQYKALRPDYLSISRVGEPVLHYWRDGRVKGQLSSNRVGRMIKDAYLPF